VIVADSIDPDAFGTLLGRLDLKRTLFNVISKSGETAETMAQFLVVRDRLLHELGAVDYKHHLVVTTGAEKGVLRQIVNDEGFRDLVVPDGVGGRFSVLTPVGLFPAAVAGIDVEELLAVRPTWTSGRARRRRSPTRRWRWRGALPPDHPAREADPGLHGVLRAPGGERRLFCQLWAESLGKAQDLTGRTVEWARRRCARSAPPTSTRSSSSTWRGRATRWSSSRASRTTAWRSTCRRPTRIWRASVISAATRSASCSTSSSARPSWRSPSAAGRARRSSSQP